MKPGELKLETARLVLRTVAAPDAGAMFRYRKLPAVRRFQGAGMTSLSDIDGIIKATRRAGLNTQGTWHQLAITLRAGGMLAGDIGMHFTAYGQAEIGYTLAPEFQGKGYAGEAVFGVVDYLFSKLKKQRVSASVDPQNHASVKLLERMGFRKEGCFIRSYWTGRRWADNAVYAVLKTEWPAMKKNIARARSLSSGIGAARI